ncbi:TIGR04376 family protein [Cyanothece sp. BG0011]|uniref:TIGR04376 family protein n=1 Tax=Cyanothece sp. BG0011 TaxID=2082950 RepID=UPI000D1D69E6|nr:TIGR04376 family protein [Cyanothece sp. BG0011]
MSIFDDFSRFLETRLEEFLKNNPHLELQALLEQLREQEQEALKLIIEKEGQKKRLETDILSLAEEIQSWHQRVAKAQAAGRLDLAQRAQEREAALLRQGNQLWGQMEGAKQQIANGKTLLTQIRQRKEEIQTKARQAQAAQGKPNYDTKGWNQTINYSVYNKATDPLEAEFQRWELDDELDQLKRDL